MVFGWDVIDPSTYNWASITKGSYTGDIYIDENGIEWRKYGDFNEATKDLGNVIQNTYFDEGRYSIEDIGSKYCDPPDNWIKVVSDFVNEMYADLGQNIVLGDENNNNNNNNENSSSAKVKIKMKDNGTYVLKSDYTDKDKKNIRNKINQAGGNDTEFSDYEIDIIGALLDSGLKINDFSTENWHCLPAFIKAEACTQYLDLRPNSEKMKNGEYVPQTIKDLKDNEVPGVILVQRTNTNSSTPVTLEYKKESDFNSLVSSNNKDAINYFTINDKGSLVIAKWDHILVEVNGEYPDKLDESEKEMPQNEYFITTEKIAYSEYVKKYIMPFDFLAQLLLMTDEKDFCMDLVNQVLNSKIVINIQEEETITETNENREYTVHVKNNKRIDYTIGKEQENDYFLRYAKDDVGNDCTNYSFTKPVVQIHKVETNHSYVFEIIESDTWIGHYKKTYAKTQPDSKTETDHVELKGKYKKDDLKNITNKSNIEKDADVKKFKQDKETNYKNQLPIPLVAVTQFSRPLPSTEAIPEQQVFRKISITPENTFTTNLTTDEFAGIPTTDIMGNTTYQYNMPQSITVTTIETDNWPFKVNFQFSLNNETYTNIGDDRNDVIKCDVTRLKIQPHSKIDLNNTITTKTTKYPTDPNPITNTHIYSKDESGNYEKFLLVYNKYPYTRAMFDSLESWLFEVMEKNGNTEGLVETIKYLLYVYDGTDRGVTELSIEDLTGETDMTNFGGSIHGNTIQEKVWFALKDLGYSDEAVAGAMGNIQYESGFNPTSIEGGYDENNGGIGICQWTNNSRGKVGRNTNLKNFAKSKGTTWQDENIQVEYLLGELGKGNASGYATCQLMTTVDAKYGRIWKEDEWEQAQGSTTDEKIENATKAFCYTFERPNASAALASIKTRIQYAKEFYQQFHGQSASTGDYSGDVVRYYQNDYANVKYGSGTIAQCGCGPTAFAMIATQLKGQVITPADAVSWCGNAYYVLGQGTSWGYFKAAAQHFGLGCSVTQTSNFSQVETALKNGKLVICSQGPGLFTRGGHFILLTKMVDGKIYVNDPNKNNAINKGYNNRAFTSAEITQAAKQYWIFK